MAVMHPRVAGNYLKDGYYPTDEATLRQLAQLLICTPGTHRFLDPCCGEGLAMAQLLREIEGEAESHIDTFGVELNAERAQLARSTLHRVLHSNAFDTVIGAGSQSFLFLNPPYGDTVSETEVPQKRAMARLEMQFTQRMLPTLKRGGLLALVIPYTSLSPAFSRYLALRLDDVSVFAAETDRFKQVVILGLKRDMRGEEHQVRRQLTAERLQKVGEGQSRLSKMQGQRRYRITPISQRPFRFEKVRPEMSELSQAFREHQGLWRHFAMTFESPNRQSVPRPLKRLSPWHLSLSLAAGQISGRVTSNDGTKQLLVKGGTQKVKKTQTSVEGAQVVTTTIDQFVPLIRAINVTPGQDFGKIVMIQ
ncbi:DUF6094 domain-containing protein [Vibrio sp. 10N.261.46.A3]|uniref:DUF6094 domain-containing protein n=1 Tax=Vibrio sp. 10N.261.46.A3 TaxID=3229658 RepID=UPI00354B3A29